ncbi:MAG: cell wall metabolism sensor histidine kinase WalK [Lachnospiraceae bacterium]|nr:cell wall metabolism sensor histidine kinase WalK [Lachnospiraceae bacterium]
MKNTLRLRFVFSYLIIALLTLILLNTYGHSAIYNKLVEYEKSKLYEEAELIAREYMPSISIRDTVDITLLKHFSALETLTNMRVWIVSPDGNIQMDSNLENSCHGENINEYDAAFLSYQSVVGEHPKGLMDDNMISVIYPITESLNTNGYLVLMSPASALNSSATNYIDSIVICGFIILSILFVIFISLYRRTVTPLKGMTAAVRAYANGRFDYRMEKMPCHEQTELADAICYLAEQMNGLNEYQKNFIANVSHDFRSPLTSIKGYTEALADGTIPAEMQEKYFNIILFETERLTKLTGNLLELNQLDHGSLVLEQDNFDINDAIKKTSASFEQRCLDKHVSLDLIFDQKELMAYGDTGKIQQVIQNLLDNAIKFSPQDSVIKIHTLQKNHKIFVSIKDYGIGIPKESQKKIWNRFYKTDVSRGKDKTGTGLGLSITKEIIDAHGENINVISTEGVGTEFIFTLPSAKI